MRVTMGKFMGFYPGTNARLYLIMCFSEESHKLLYSRFVLILIKILICELRFHFVFNYLEGVFLFSLYKLTSVDISLFTSNYAYFLKGKILLLIYLYSFFDKN